MADSAIPTATEEATARELAEKAGLEYRQPGAVTVDPRALSVLPAGECRRLRAVPLASVAGSAVVAVADPSDERLNEIRGVAGEGTRFVVLTERTLEALLHSRMFAGAPAAAPRPPQPVEPPAAAAPAPAAEAPEPQVFTAPTPPPAFAPAPAAAQQPLVLEGTFVDAIVTALVPKLQALVPAPPPAPAETKAAPETPTAEPSETAPASVAELLTHIDESLASWTRLRSALEAIGTELDESRQNLREAKERLSVAHAEGDQHQRRVVALEAELAERRALVEETRLRLREAAEALGEGVIRLEAPTELY